MGRFDPPSPYELTGPIITAQFDCAYEVTRTERTNPPMLSSSEFERDS